MGVAVEGGTSFSRIPHPPDKHGPIRRGLGQRLEGLGGQSEISEAFLRDLQPTKKAPAGATERRGGTAHFAAPAEAMAL